MLIKQKDYDYINGGSHSPMGSVLSSHPADRLASLYSNSPQKPWELDKGSSYTVNLLPYLLQMLFYAGYTDRCWMILQCREAVL